MAKSYQTLGKRQQIVTSAKNMQGQNSGTLWCRFLPFSDGRYKPFIWDMFYFQLHVSSAVFAERLGKGSSTSGAPPGRQESNTAQFVEADHSPAFQ